MKGIMSDGYTEDHDKWSMTVQVCFEVDPADVKVIFDDDSEIDFIYRAWSRFTPVLEGLVKEGKVSSYRIEKVPHRLPEKAK